ncbi:hypothetical protein [Buttiauxella noackiae]|uniref:hypothetical protein n=1 Tax=Buttiauxella noackiae TaxID=82992 RepID=UPI0028D67A07|nr:hypothetical protein [Buttiauxella noackiae]
MTTNIQKLEQLTNIVKTTRENLDKYDSNKQRIITDYVNNKLNSFDLSLGYKEIVASPTLLRNRMRELIADGYSVVDFNPLNLMSWRMTLAPAKLPTQKQRHAVLTEAATADYEKNRQPLVLSVTAAENDLATFKAQVRDQQLAFDALCM